MRKSFYALGLLFSCFFLSAIVAKAAPTTTGTPVITANPHDTTACSGSTVWFAVTANDTAGGGHLAIGYTWEVSTDGGSTWDTVHNVAPYSHATTDTLKALINTSMNGYLYMCGATNDSGTTWSDPAVLGVDTAYAGAITGSVPVCAGSTVALASSVAGGVWSNVNHATDTVNSAGVVYGKAQGFDTVKYALTNTCGVATSWTIVRVDTFVMNFGITGPTSTCVGNIIDLMNVNVFGTTDNVFGTGVWSASNATAFVNAAGMVEGVSSGLDTITYSFTNACNSVDTSIAIRTDTVLAHGTISGTTNNVCAGSWISFTESVPDGVWLSGDPAVAVTDASGNVTGISQGTAVISYYLSNACGVSTATDTVSVSRVASEITGIDSVGIGANRTLFDTTSGGTWTSGNTLVATIGSTTGIAHGVAAGTTVITYSVTNICGTTFATMVLNVGHNPSAGVIRGKDSVCIGSTITLSDTVAGGVWSTLSDSIATVNDTGLVTGVSYGIGHITYTYTNAFGSTSVVTGVFVNHVKVDSIKVPNIFAVNVDYTFVGYPAGGTWHTSNTTVGNFIGSPGFFVIYHAGIDTITYTYTNSCGTADTSFIITVPFSEGVNEVANGVGELKVYPNPSEGDFTINLVSSVTEPVVVTITNIVGEKVKEFTISTNQPSDLKLDQPDGIYFLTAATPTGKYTAKITITK